MKKTVALVVLSLCCSFCFGQTLDTKAIDSIFAEWDKEGVPGCALGIVKDGKLIYGKGYGMANLEYDIQNDANSVFRIASTSKQFTAACIVLLAEQEKLSLDNKLNQFFPAFPDYAKQITIRHLLNHTSGIRDYLTVAALKGLGDNDHYEDEDVMKWLVHQKELNFKPGEEFLYSNSGYWLLGQIVNQVAGMNMAEYAKQEIFEPLGMNSTHFHNNHNEIVKNRATGYMPTADESFQISMTTLEMIGDGGIFTSVNDIKKWDDSYYNSSVLSKAFWNEMTHQGVLNSGEVQEYASGLGLSNFKGLKVISHGGAFVGFRAELMRFPEEHLSIAIFANRADANPTRLAYKVADVLFKEKFEASRSKNGNTKMGKRPEIVQLTVSELEKFSGSYWNDQSMLARKIYVKNDTLMYARSATNETTLLPIGTNEFTMPNVGPPVVVKFYKDEEGNKMMSFSQNNSEPSVSKEYLPTSSYKDELLAYTGVYYSKELDVNYVLKMNDESLILFINDKEVAPLKEIMTYLFSLDRFGTVQFNTNERGAISSFSLAAGRVKNLLFEKQ